MALLRLVAAAVVILIWGAAYGQSIVKGTPTPPAELSGLMLAVFTWLSAGAARSVAGGEPGALRRAIGRLLIGQPPPEPPEVETRRDDPPSQLQLGGDDEA